MRWAAPPETSSHRTPRPGFIKLTPVVIIRDWTIGQMIGLWHIYLINSADAACHNMKLSRSRPDDTVWITLPELCHSTLQLR